MGSGRVRTGGGGERAGVVLNLALRRWGAVGTHGGVSGAPEGVGFSPAEDGVRHQRVRAAPPEDSEPSGNVAGT